TGSGVVCADHDLVADGKVQAGVTTNAACVGDGAICGHGNVVADGNVVSGGMGALKAAVILSQCSGTSSDPGAVETFYVAPGLTVSYDDSTFDGVCYLKLNFAPHFVVASAVDNRNCVASASNTFNSQQVEIGVACFGFVLYDVNHQRVT